MTLKDHWEGVYVTKQPSEMSWTQEEPMRSLNFINGFNVPKSEPIIDIGGGESNLVDFLIKEGYTDLTVLDISEASLDRAKERLGELSQKVNWIVSDVVDFNPSKKYRIWHDRATFHFLTEPSQIESYVSIANKAVEGYMVIGTFSDKGPKKCSGLEIRRYSENQLENSFFEGFEKIECINEDHNTPFDTFQNFTFCSFKKRSYNPKIL